MSTRLTIYLNPGVIPLSLIQRPVLQFISIQASSPSVTDSTTRLPKDGKPSKPTLNDSLEFAWKVKLRLKPRMTQAHKQDLTHVLFAMTLSLSCLLQPLHILNVALVIYPSGKRSAAPSAGSRQIYRMMRPVVDSEL